ncbi:MAG TPA: isoprenylcysteine carboxylmethyltransferase family protein [Anaerolineales bacterium]|nr:isoprenylcysteine carboxylmethyltransferase family protein [Anaerolineales bacterium]
MNATQLEPSRDEEIKAGIGKRFTQVAGITIFQAAILFLASGDLKWVWAWVFLGLNAAGIAMNAFLLLKNSPETVAERARSEGMKDWDKVIGGLWSVMYFILTLLVAGLDWRFGWTGLLSLGVHVAGILIFSLGFAVFSWAMVTNAYFAAVVRIQEERGQTVCTSGPYRFARHPGYVGAILQSLGTPLLLGSYWAFFPGLLAVGLMIARTYLEDRTLQSELPGYREYTLKVKYRLLPGIW